MSRIIHRVASIGAVASATFALAAVIAPGVSGAAECGWGTVFDPPSNSCVAAAPPPPPAPVWNGDITPYFSVGVCAPIPFVSLCTGI